MAVAVHGAQTPWQAACQLHATLFNGWALDPLSPPVPGLTPEVGEHVIGVFPTGPGQRRLDYARWVAEDILIAAPGPRLVVGTPHFLAGYALGSVVAAGRRRRKARQLAQPQWRHRPMASAVVTTRRLWCDVSGQGWRHFGYAHTTDVILDGEKLVLHFTNNVASLRLDGPWAPWIAVAIAHHRFGTEATFRLPWLTAMHKATASA
jgi:hypothetical protein